MRAITGASGPSTRTYTLFVLTAGKLGLTAPRSRDFLSAKKFYSPYHSYVQFDRDQENQLQRMFEKLLNATEKEFCEEFDRAFSCSSSNELGYLGLAPSETVDFTNPDAVRRIRAFLEKYAFRLSAWPRLDLDDSSDSSTAEQNFIPSIVQICIDACEAVVKDPEDSVIVSSYIDAVHALRQQMHRQQIAFVQLSPYQLTQVLAEYIKVFDPFDVSPDLIKKLGETIEKSHPMNDRTLRRSLEQLRKHRTKEADLRAAFAVILSDVNKPHSELVRKLNTFSEMILTKQKCLNELKIRRRA